MHIFLLLLQSFSFAYKEPAIFSEIQLKKKIFLIECYPKKKYACEENMSNDATLEQIIKAQTKTLSNAEKKKM